MEEENVDLTCKKVENVGSFDSSLVRLDESLRCLSFMVGQRRVVNLICSFCSVVDQILFNV